MIYAMSDIHGCLAAFTEALELIDISGDNKLVLLGDYIHGGEDSYGVMDRIIELQHQYGTDKVIALKGNHESMALDGSWRIAERKHENVPNIDYDEERDEKYLSWMKDLPLYYVQGNTIFCHAGIDEEAGEYWEISTDDYTYMWKNPVQTGKFHCGNLDMKIVAGHIGTSKIAHNPRFHDIYFDGESHYYIDGTVLRTRKIPILAVDTVNNKYYQMKDSGLWIAEPYDENWKYCY